MSKKPEIKSDSLPFFATKTGLCLSMASLIGIILALSLVLSYSYRYDGFRALSNEKTAPSQLVWKFIPTLIATLFASAWAVLHRDISVMEPFIDLAPGHAHAHDSLSLKFASRPPIKGLAEAFKCKRFLVGLVSLMTLSTSILSVAMGGLFSRSMVGTNENSVEYTSAYGPKMLPSDWNPLALDMSRALDVLRSGLTDGTRNMTWARGSTAFVPIKVPKRLLKKHGKYYGVTVGITADLACEAMDMSDETNATLGGTGFGTLPNGLPMAYWQARSYNNSLQANCSLSMPFPLNDTTQSIRYRWSEPLAGLANSSSQSICRSASLIVVEQGEWWSTWKSSSTLPARRRSASICRPSLTVQNWNIEFNDVYHVSSAAPADPSTNDIISANEYFDGVDEFIGLFNSHFLGSANDSSLRDQHYSYDWPGLLAARLKSLAVTNSSFLSPAAQTEAVRIIYGRTFSAFFSTYRNRLLARSKDPVPLPAGSAQYRESRMLPSLALFVISLFLLSMYMLVAFCVVTRRRQRFSGPRIPKSLGSIMPWVLHSHMLKDFESTHCLSTEQKDKRLAELNKTYGFGWFNGTDGKPHLGIEQEPLPKRYLPNRYSRFKD